VVRNCNAFTRYERRAFKRKRAFRTLKISISAATLSSVVIGFVLPKSSSDADQTRRGFPTLHRPEIVDGEIPVIFPNETAI
jgi:hypothetical protein